MCGITGIFSRSGVPIPAESLAPMMHAMVHRGPDEGGHYTDQSVALGMRRLSIIDRSGGHQPITNEDRSLWLVMNGELYNYRELRAELLQRGHTFTTSSDTEVAVHLYEEMGNAFVERLRGMFAIALFDTKTRRLVLARDRLGKKPLYYAVTDDFLIFGSEIKALHSSGLLSKRLHTAALHGYLTYGYVPNETTLFADVLKVPPASVLEARATAVDLNQYWDVPVGARTPAISAADAPAAVRTLLEESVRIRLMSEVPLGAFLSGGTDSSAIVAIMTRLLNRPVQTFSIGFGDATLDELGYARIAAEHSHTEHHELRLDHCPLELLERVNHHHDEPASDPANVPTFELSRFARQKVTVVLTGEGGDELFGGYHHYQRYQRLLGAERRIPGFRWLARLADHGSGYLNGRVNGRLGKALWVASLPPERRYGAWHAILPPAIQHALLQPAFDHDALEETDDHYATYARRAAAIEPIARFLYLDTRLALPEQLLMKTDKMTMAASIEARCPLLDQQLVELAAGLPLGLKVTPTESKLVLRRAIAPLVAPALLNRPKHGFDVPIRTWLLRDLQEPVQELLLSAYGPLRTYIRAEAVRASWQRLLERNDQLLARQLWLLLNLAVWHRLHWQ